MFFPYFQLQSLQESYSTGEKKIEKRWVKQWKKAIAVFQTASSACFELVFVLSSSSAYNFGSDTTEGVGERHQLFSVVKKAIDFKGKTHQNKVEVS